ncbi:MAG: outer membrane protein transport protein [Spirochaetota bacterium]|nr:outer membrane protein transport protein [Spirochaetota bacterium]
MIRINSLVLVIITIFLTQPLFADMWNHRNLLVGERGAMMGGAYTALSEDISGAFYNPGGLGFISKPALSLTTNIYGYRNWDLNTYDSRGVDNIQFERFELIPGTLGISFNLSENLVLAYSIIQSDTIKFDGSITSQRKVETMSINFDSFLTGPSLAYKISDKLAVGVSVFYHYFQGKFTSFRDEVSFSGVPGARSTVRQENQATSGGITSVLGFKWNVTNEFKLGLSYGSETIHTNGTSTGSRVDNDTFYGPSPIETSSGEGDVRLPHRVALGLAYDVKNKFTVSVDVLYNFELDYPYPYHRFDPLNPNSRHYEKGQFNLSVGGEAFISKSFALRAGFFTNRSTAAEEWQNFEVDIYGGAFGIGYVKDGLSSGIGVNVSYGSEDSSPFMHWKRLEISIIIGGTVLFGS